jgi:hypothetical protein
MDRIAWLAEARIRQYLLHERALQGAALRAYPAPPASSAGRSSGCAVTGRPRAGSLSARPTTSGDRVS